MATALRWTTADLDAFPQPLDDTRYEIIDGELYVSTQPRWEHQHCSGEAHAELRDWSRRTGLGMAIWAPGVMFAGDDNVAPDVVWVSKARLPLVLGPDGKLHAAPDLVIEVLSPGPQNEQRDRGAKLKLYSQRGVHEYWIMDWQRREVEVYRREGGELPALRLVATLTARDTLQSPLLPGFACPVGQLVPEQT